MRHEPCDLITAVKNLLRPLVPRSVLRERAERACFSRRSLHARHLGAFSSFAEANAHIAGRAVAVDGYVLDHEAWLEERLRLSAHDYPPLFWLSRLVFDERRSAIADFGGSVGVSFYAFERYVKFPAGVHWIVCELPQVVELGSRIARDRGESRLEFVAEPAVLSGASVFFAAGALQYLEQPLGQLLTKSALHPEYLIINKLPLSARDSFITIEGGGNGFYPCRVQSAPSFISEMRDLGYEVVGRWKCLEHAMKVVLRPDLSFAHYQGFVLRRY